MCEVETEAKAVAQPGPRGAGGEAPGLRRVVWAMTVILGLSLALNLAQAFRIRELNQSKRGASDSTSIQVGTTVSPAKVRDTEGGRR